MAATINDVRTYYLGSAKMTVVDFSTDDGTADNIGTGLSWVEFSTCQQLTGGSIDNNYSMTKNSSSGADTTENDLGKVSIGAGTATLSGGGAGRYLLMSYGR